MNPPGQGKCGADRYDDVTGEEVQSCYAGPEADHDCGVPLRAGDNLRCGCVNLTQLEQWFQCPNGREVMAAHGYVGKVYDVDREDVYFGAHQVVFPIDEAEAVGSFDLKTLTEMDHA
jgi:hypothetical protein